MILQFSQRFQNVKCDEKEQSVWVDTAQGFDQEVACFYGWLEEGVLEPFQIKEDFAKGIGFLENLALTGYPRKIRTIKGQITTEVSRRLKEWGERELR